MNLHQNKQDFRDAVQATAENLKIRAVYVEKDYWVSLLLKRLSTHPKSSELVFKGGTSLSKAYKVVKRFSEDVDIAIVKGNKTDAAIGRLIKEIAKDVTVAPFIEREEPGITSKKGLMRRTLHEYPRSIAGTNFGPVRDQLLLEVNCFGNPTPALQMVISSFITEHLEAIGAQSTIEEYSLHPFKISVLDWKITFVEKILSLAYASMQDGMDKTIELRSRVRHFYDLTMLFSQREFEEYLLSQEFLNDLRRIRQDERLASRTKWTDTRLVEAPLFANPKTAMDNVEGFFAADLKEIVIPEGNLPQFKEVRNCFATIQDRVGLE
ncbi:MAG: nucleotidyl transferase AbiEii/AbiGii toxin family protein [Deltaproteobacteria bacterium]|nr:nucleotidyl transferase AbiEii/AbiGii toxin family protein [Deltaproteobacteria bacterium]